MSSGTGAELRKTNPPYFWACMVWIAFLISLLVWAILADIAQPVNPNKFVGGPGGYPMQGLPQPVTVNYSNIHYSSQYDISHQPPVNYSKGL